MKQRCSVLLVLILLALPLMAATPAASQAEQFDGGPDVGKLTGAKINVITVPFSDLYQKILTDLATGTNSYQAFVFDPQWMADFTTPGYLEELTNRVKADKALQWADIGAFFRNFSA